MHIFWRLFTHTFDTFEDPRPERGREEATRGAIEWAKKEGGGGLVWYFRIFFFRVLAEKTKRRGREGGEGDVRKPPLPINFQGSK